MNAQPSSSTESSAVQRRFALLSFVTAACTYALIVFGGIVRITGSGMGCGDDWPLCNGRLIPPMDFETLIEYGHRLAALLVSVLVFAVAAYAIRHRRAPALTGQGVVGLASVSVLLLVAQVIVGAVTVWLELPTGTVVLHLAVASVLLATLIIGGLRALPGWPAGDTEGTGDDGRPWVLASVSLGFAALLFGGLVANSGAAPLCQGFPLCNGQLLPEGGALVHLHWTHRLLGYGLLVVVCVAAFKTLRGSAGGSAVAVSALLLVIAQIGVAAAMVLLRLPPALQALHLAVGMALWAVLVVWATRAMRGPALARAGAAEPVLAEG